MLNGYLSRICLVFVLIMIGGIHGWSQVLQVDPAFNATDLGNGYGDGIYGVQSIVYDVVIEPDDQLIIAGNFTHYNGESSNGLVRINADGSKDNSFNIGTGILSKAIHSAVRQSDGKIIIGGTFTEYNGQLVNSLVRLNDDGSIDPTFFSPEINGTIQRIALQSDGKVLVAGDFTQANQHAAHGFMRLNANGSEDLTFNQSGAGNTGGFANGGVLAITVQADNNILIGGYFTHYNGTQVNRIARLKPDGTLDATFNGGQAFDGTYDKINVIRVQSDGKILIGGEFDQYDSSPSKSLVRLHANGTFDNTFNVGSGVLGFVQEMMLLPSGEVLVAGNFSSYNGVSRSNIVQLYADGTIHNSQYAGQTFDNTIYALERLSTDAVICGGNFTRYGKMAYNKLMCVNPTSTPDLQFNSNTGANGEVITMQEQSDGKIVAGGTFTWFNGTPVNYLMRLLPDGNIDPTFQGHLKLDGIVTVLAIQSDDKIVVGGYFYNYDTIPRPILLRINANGSYDTTFHPPAWQDGAIIDMVIQPDGKIVVSGYFSFDLSGYNRVTRLLVDGTQDPGFQQLPIQATENFESYTAKALCLQPDGKILYGTSSDGFAAIGNFGRLFADGTIDNDFTIGGGPNGTVNEIIMDDASRIILAGFFTHFDGIPVGKICRINTDGTFDTSFEALAGANYITYLKQLGDGQILLAGYFTEYNGVSRPGICTVWPDGSLNQQFDPGTGVSIYSSFTPGVRACLVQNEALIIGGRFTKFNGTGKNRIIRLLAPDLGTTSNSFTENTSWCPNPAQDQITIQHPEQITRYEIYDLQGRIQVQGKVSDSPVIRLEQLPPASYLLKVYDQQGKITTHKIVKN